MFINDLLKDNNIINLTIYGSFCYGTFCPNQSDIDILCIIADKEQFLNSYPFIGETVEDNILSLEESLYNSKNIEIHFYTKDNWLSQIKQNTEFMYEVYFSKYNLKYQWDWKSLVKKDTFLIRKAFSSKASNSFVKCKKKILVESLKENKEKNIYIAKKSLWHSLKIFTFGIELMEKDCITLENYSLIQCYHEIMDLNIGGIKLWEALSSTYKPLYNQLHTQFKLACDKPFNSSFKQ